MSTGIDGNLGEPGMGAAWPIVPGAMSLTGPDGTLITPGETVPSDQLNSFLRGEISAAETYRMALEKFGGSTATENRNAFGLLREMQEEHGRAAQALRDRIRELGGEPSDSSGAWGVWAKFTEGVANLFGDNASLKALKEGEEHGLKDYEAGLNQIDGPSADLIENQLIPAQRRHINLLDQLLSGGSSQ